MNAKDLSDEELDDWDTRTQNPWDKVTFIKCQVCHSRFAQLKRNQLYCSKKCCKRAEYEEHKKRLWQKIANL